MSGQPQVETGQEDKEKGGYVEEGEGGNIAPQ